MNRAFTPFGGPGFGGPGFGGPGFGGPGFGGPGFRRPFRPFPHPFFPRRFLFPFFFFSPFFFPFFREDGEDDRNDMYYAHHQAQAGDTLDKVAHMYNIPCPILEEANPHITNPYQIQQGTTVSIPRISHMYCHKTYMESEVQSANEAYPAQSANQAYPAQSANQAYPAQSANQTYPGHTMPAAQGKKPY